MSCDTNTKSSEKHLPPRNTQYSRHSLLKKQREQILQLRQINLVAHDVSILKCVSNPSYCPTKKCFCTRKDVSSAHSEQNTPTMRLPKTQRSPYATCLAYNNTTSMINQKKPWTPNSNGRYSSRSANQIHASPRKTPSFQQFHNSKADVNGLKQCYRRICNDDVESFKLLLKNQERFGKPKIPLVIEQKPKETIHSRTCNNSFPIKKAPYVPQSFLKRTKRKPVSPTMEPLTSTTKHNNRHDKGQVTKRYDERPKIVEPCIIVDSPSTINNFSTTTMSREEFISINESMLDEDMIAVPTAEGILLSRSSSSVSNIIEEMIKDRKINITEDNSNEPNGEIRDEKEQKNPKIDNKDQKIDKDQNLDKDPKIDKDINELVLRNDTKIKSNNDIPGEEKMQVTNREPSNKNENHNEEVVNEEVVNEGISIKIKISKEEGIVKANGELLNKEEIKEVTGEENGANVEKTVSADHVSNGISNNNTPTSTTTATTPTPSIVGFQVMNENGDEEKNIIWHDPAEQTYHESSEEILSSSKDLAAKRKSELKQLLEEYSTIATELDQMEVV